MRRDAIFFPFVILLIVGLYYLYLTRPWEPSSVEHPIFVRYIDKNNRVYEQFLSQLSHKLESIHFSRSHHPYWRGADYKRKMNGLDGEVYWFQATMPHPHAVEDPSFYLYYLRLERYPAPLYAFRLSAIVEDRGDGHILDAPDPQVAKEINDWAQEHDADLTEATVEPN